MEADRPLPVELTQFNALSDGSSILIRWETASETNNAGFFVEMTETGHENTFDQVAFIDGHGTTDQAQSYRHRIGSLPVGTYLVRLKQVDFDGAFEYSPVVEVLIGTPSAYVVEPVYPNPASDQARLRVAVQRSQQVDVSLYDMLGRRLHILHTGPMSEGQVQEVSIDLRGLSSGLYIVRVEGDSFVNTQSLIRY
jgi:hypothetical protein